MPCLVSILQRKIAYAKLNYSTNTIRLCSSRVPPRKETFKLGDCFFDKDTGVLRSSLKREKNEFELLSIPAGIDVDMRKVEANMRALQRRLHPDKFAQKSQEERKKAELVSAKINAAYAIIRDPLTRANSAIALKLGRDVLAEDSANVDMELLTEILETREAVDECQDEMQLRQICDQNDSLIRSTHRDVHDLYISGDFESAAHLLVRLQYYLKIRLEIRHKSEEYGWALHCAVPII
mmetsp:Transcript_17494/g.22803  ORF Transcript_17494/g.22803 Transcript_17494/m.22803 type:complete len:237 (-) Transcript_17494:275-985(-)